MEYISTRGKSPAIRFDEIVTSGLARDGGLYMPETFPSFTLEEIKSWKNLPYPELAYKIIQPFVDGAIPDADLKKLLEESYKGFNDPKVAPLTTLYDGMHLLELYHGPTLAFKDFALQLLGRMLDYVLSKKNEDVIIIGATSGDTGSAAIEGCKHSKHVKIFMLHPHNRTSEIQRRQMTTVADANVLNIAVKGNFDDCQSTVKALFQNPDFAGGKRLVAVNSINWARIVAQIVYYFSAYLQLKETPESIAFSVPTGNFGDIFAGYVAYKMGLPISQLIVATNSNDILHRFFKANDYSQKEVKPTLSPSMDIQISSNFERLLFDANNRNGAAVAQLMADFKNRKSLKVSEEVLKKVRKLFTSHSTDDEATKKIIKEVFTKCGKVIDPHTATGVDAALKARKSTSVPMIVLATAHPAKFPAAIKEAGVPEPEVPEHIAAMMTRPERFEVLEFNADGIKQYIKNNL